MANAPDGVKESADYITARTNNKDGVAEVLEKFVLQDHDYTKMVIVLIISHSTQSPFY